ncbi:UDP-3-O-[3-hydroxymyristoyl] glucosamine N-acyltransferase [Alteromonadaceae bacterium Bs31]|nr:UDP-3-O-[3-hydroxymyristoyl] glucosamine N-acyltransferase [Alteromonadaceae bacterium Bs31]
MSDKSYSLQQLADYLKCEFIGEADKKVDALASLEKAQQSQLTFVAQDKYVKLLDDCEAGIVVLKPGLQANWQGNRLLVDDPYKAFAQLSKLFETRPKAPIGVHPSSVVAESAQISATARIAANCVIEEGVSIGEHTEIGPGCVVGANSVIGENCLLHANVSVYHDVSIGSHCIVHSGTVLGSDGFGFAPSKEEGWVKIHQLGGLRIGERVEIGSNTSIDRGALSDTVIEKGVIIDNLVHIAHGVHIGEGTAIAGCVGVAGSTTIGKHCTIAGAVAINGHIEIADNVHFHGGTIVTKGISEPGAYASIAPVQDVKKWRRNSVRYTQLDELASRVRKLEKNT